MKAAVIFGASALLLAAAPAARSGQRPAHPKPPAGEQTLRALADRIGFKIGAAIAPMAFREEPQYGEVLAHEFNAAESVTIFKLVEPKEGDFNFNMIDHEMEFARRNGLTLFGGPLIYKPSTLPPWMHKLFWTQGELDNVTRRHIDTVVRHGDESYSAWEVVNEPLTTANRPWGTTFSREEYIARAFRYAHEANPRAVLVLNQSFGRAGVDPEMANQCFNLISAMRARNVAVNAVGIEMHLEMQMLRPDYLQEFREFLARAEKARLQVYVTEMDAYQGPPGTFPDAMDRQKKVYHDVLATCLSSPACTAFYTWGVSDRHNMYQNRPEDRRPDAKPLPFDDNYQKKPAYYGMLEALQERVAKTR
jgi:endo-1,4-beta-xylanase